MFVIIIFATRTVAIARGGGFCDDCVTPSRFDLNVEIDLFCDLGGSRFSGRGLGKFSTYPPDDPPHGHSVHLRNRSRRATGARRDTHSVTLTATQ